MESKYLTEKDAELKGKLFSGASLSDLIHPVEDSDDEIAQFISDYFSSSANKIAIDGETLKLINRNVDESSHILIRILLQYLIASSKEINRSKLNECCAEYIEDYFKGSNYSDDIDYFSYPNFIKAEIPADNLVIALRWTLQRFPQNKKCFSKLLAQKLDEKETSSILALCLLDRLLNDDRLCNLFNPQKYVSQYDRYLIGDPEISVNSLCK